MLPDQVSNPGPPTYESGALPIALRGFNLVYIKSKFSASPERCMCEKTDVIRIACASN